MAKYRVQVFPRKVRESEGNGTTRAHRISAEAQKGLGQGMKILFHGRVYAVSANARLDFQVKTGSFPLSASDEPLSVTLTGTCTNITTTGAFSFSTTTDLHTDVECWADVSASSGTTQTTVDFELWSTVITQT